MNAPETHGVPPEDPLAMAPLVGLGVVGLVAAGAAFQGGWIGVVGVVGLVVAAGGWSLRRGGASAGAMGSTPPHPVAPQPAPDALGDSGVTEESASGEALLPLPIEHTEAVEEDGMGAVWRAALDACLDGIFIVDPDERLLYANPAVGRILGCVPLDLIGTHATEHLPGLDDEESSTAGFRRTKGGTLGMEWMTQARRAGGSTFPAEVTITPLGDRGMGVYQVRDVTEQVQDEERARQRDQDLEQLRGRADEASHTKSAFLANMSHELRTPLNAILGYSEMLDEELTDAAARDDVRKIRSAGRHLMGLINSILDLSKIEAGRMELFMETVSVRLFLGELEALAAPQAQASGNRFTVDADEGVGRLVTDQSKLRQVLMHLLGNAFKFTRDGHVQLRARRETRADGDRVLFEVEDDGIGIAPEQLGRIFQEFDQGDASSTRRFGGSGLGLALGRRFCRMMGGELDVHSDPGAGSRFTVSLPANTLEASVGLHNEGASARVLVIDDDPGVRELMARTLAGGGYQVLTASSGEEGLASARSFRPHVITLDVMMPGMDGWSVLAALKADEVLRDVPVVMVSMVDERRKGYALGATAYLTKPIERSHLLDLVARFRGADELVSVLVVDDDPAVRDLVRRTLAGSDLEVFEAADGAEALARILERPPSLVLLDLLMPGMDGFELLDRLASDERVASIPVVVLSSLELTAPQRAQLEERVAHILRKGSVESASWLEQVRDRVSRHVRDTPDTPARS